MKATIATSRVDRESQQQVCCGPPLEELAAFVRQVQDNPSLYPLELEDERFVLFRIDGLTIEVSQTLYDLLHVDPSSLPPALEALRVRRGAEEVTGATTALIALASEVGLGEEPPLLRRPDPATSRPGGILIMVTQTCNLACTYCYADEGTYGGRQKLMSERNALKAIDLMLKRAPGRDRFTVTFFGGEPLLNFPVVRAIVAYCSAKAESSGVKFDYAMTTNGTIVTDEIIDFLLEHRITPMVSYDGPQQTKNRPFGSGESSKKLVEKNIRRLTDAGLRLRLRAPLTQEAISHEAVDGLVRLTTRLGAQSVVTSPASEIKNADLSQDPSSLPQHDDGARIREIFKAATRRSIGLARSGIREEVKFDPYNRLIGALAGGKAVGLGKCGAGFGMVAASTDGRLFPCHRFVGMDGYEIGTVEGGVDNERLEEFFVDAAAANEPSCSTCYARQICGGFCFYNMSDGDGGFNAPTQEECDGFRDGLRFAIGSMLHLRSLDPDQFRTYQSNMRAL